MFSHAEKRFALGSFKEPSRDTRPWWMRLLFRAPPTTLTEFIQRVPANQLDWLDVSANPNIPIEFILNNPQYRLWDRHSVALNPNVTPAIIRAYPNKHWNWGYISGNQNLTWEFVCENSDKPWNWDLLSANRAVTIDIVKANPDKQWNWDSLSKNPNITLDIIKANPDRPWSFHHMSYNPNLTCEFVMANPDKEWDWCSICARLPLTAEFIDANKDKFFVEFQLHPHQPNLVPSQLPRLNWDIISRNKHMNVEENPQYPWVWNYVSSNPSITWEFVQANLHKDWNWTRLSENPAITLDIINAHPEYPWDEWGILRNPNCTFEFALSRNKLYRISSNKFEYDDTVFERWMRTVDEEHSAVLGIN
jgi:hypothetical protein